MAAGRSWINYWSKSISSVLTAPVMFMLPLITNIFLFISSTQLQYLIMENMNRFQSIFNIFPFPSLDCQGLMTHAEGSPHGNVLISFWNQVDLLKMFSCKRLEEKLAAIWVSKQSVVFQDSHRDNPRLLNLNLFLGEIGFGYNQWYRPVSIRDTFGGKKSHVLCEDTQ